MKNKEKQFKEEKQRQINEIWGRTSEEGNKAKRKTHEDKLSK